MRIYRAPSLRAGVSSLAICFLLLGYRAVAAQGLEEVIVTAQKREQGLQDVPISVEAFSAEQIDNLSAQDIADLGVFAPNVEIDRAANQPNYRIRGIGTSDFGVGADPAVGVYQDGVYIGRSGGSKVAFNDIARVEILNGPQGTLFGRNAAAGAIQYITNKAEDDLYGWARLTLGNYDRRQVDGVINVPLTDKLYFRSGILWNRRDGWVDNLYNGDDLARRGSRALQCGMGPTASGTCLHQGRERAQARRNPLLVRHLAAPDLRHGLGHPDFDHLLAGVQLVQPGGEGWFGGAVVLLQ
jgi:iron complex outermembrane receptor protein